MVVGTNGGVNPGEMYDRDGNRGKVVKLRKGECVRIADTVIQCRTKTMEVYIYGKDKITHVKPCNTLEELNERIRMDTGNL